MNMRRPSPHSSRSFPRLLAAASLLVLLCTAILAPGSLAAGTSDGSTAHPSAAHRSQGRGPSYMTGIGDEQGEMFSNSLYTQLHTKIVRYIAPYDASVRGYSLKLAREWIGKAEAEHLKVLVAFYHSEYTKRKMPSVATYSNDVKKFIKDFPHVREYQAWDEANRGYVSDGGASFSSPSAVQDAQYYRALKRDCQPCTVIGLDVLDNPEIGGTLEYIAEFKREIYRLKTLMPSIWGLHNYSDLNHFESWRTRDLVKAMGSQVWLTETGGVVKFGNAFPNKRGSGLRRAAKVLKYMFGVAAAVPQIKRLYIYDWTGGTPSTRFDAGLMNARDKPREGYVVVCRQLHAAHCNVRIVGN
jgi:hypothetical protein